MTAVEPTCAAVLQTAIAALELGLTPVPPKRDGTKAPDGPALDGQPGWKRWQTTRPTRDQVEQAFTGRTGIGLMCGTISGDLEMLEFEGRAIAEGLGGQFSDACDAAGLTALWDRILTGYTERTPSGGIHVLYSCPGVEGNLKLARRPSTADELTGNADELVQVLIETRGEGGYTVIAPSHGTTHPTGNAWEIIQGGLASIAIVTPDERAALHAIARSFDQLPDVDRGTPAPSPAATPPATSTSTGERPGDEFNQQHTAQQVLEAAGFQYHHQDTEGTHYTRPGKDPRHGSSATVWSRDGRVTLFSSSIDAPLEIIGNSRLDAWRLHVALNHHGDHSAAASDWRHDHPAEPVDLEQLIGQQAPELLASPSTPAATTQESVDDTRDPADAVGSSWRPTDLTAVIAGLTDGSHTTPTPDLGRFTNTAGALWYRGRVNGLYGESGKGKSWIAIAVAAEVLLDGGTVAWIDLEEPAEGIVRRLLVDLGVPAAAIADRFLHFAPEESILRGQEHLQELLTARPPDYAVIDSTGEALALEGAKPNNDDEVARWFRYWPRWIATRTGAGVVVIDHVIKDESSRGLFPGGSQRKRAAINGSAFMVTPVIELGRGRLGRLKLVTAKDRQGWHRNGTRAAEFILDATTTPSAWHLEGHVDDGKPFRPTVLMGRISDFLTATHRDDEWVSKIAIEKGVRGNAEACRKALQMLIDEGYVEMQIVGQRHRHRLVKPFDDLDELTSTAPDGASETT